LGNSSTVRYRGIAARLRDGKTPRISSAQRDRPYTHQWIKANHTLIAIREWRILWIFVRRVTSGLPLGINKRLWTITQRNN
jgi:hypothetical protein